MNRIRKRRFIATLVILFVLGFIFFSVGYKECEDVTYTYKDQNFKGQMAMMQAIKESEELQKELLSALNVPN